MSIKSLDHFLLLTKNLEKAAFTYKRLGFHVRPIARHKELGSSNCVIHFPNTYLELFWLGEADESLTSQYRDRFKCGEGLAHISLTSDDLVAEQGRLRDLGLEPGQIMSARRQVIMPDGFEDETDSNCFYLWRDDARYLSLFFSEHKKPKAIYIPEYEKHPNSAIDVTRLVYMSADPAGDIDYFSKAFGKGPDFIENDHFLMIGGRGDVTEVLTSKTAVSRYGDSLSSNCPDPLEGFPVAIHMGIHDLSLCRQVLQRGGVSYQQWGNGLIVPATAALGCAWVFEEVVAKRVQI